MKKVVGILCLLFMMLATTSFAAYPAELEKQESENLEENITEEGIMPISENSFETTNEEIIDEDVYKMENEVIIDEVVNGNLYVMAKTVKLDQAVIYGNVFLMAETIEIDDSEIDGSVFAAGEKINFSGMANDVYACGAEIDFDLNSYVWRTARVACDTFHVNGNIGRNLYASVNTLSVGDQANIEGILNYFSEQEGTISEQAQIAEVQFEQEIENNNEERNYIFEAINVAFKTFIIALIMVFGIHKLNTLKRTENVAVDFLKSAAKGSLCLILIPILAVLLMISIIGVGFGVIVLVFYIIALYIATSIVSVEIAHRIAQRWEESQGKKGRIIGIAVLISLVIWAFQFIPVVGEILRFIIVLIGLGIMFDILFQKTKKEEINEN